MSLFGYKPRLPFWTSVLLAAIFALVLAGCELPSSATQVAGPSDGCGPIEPTDADVQKVLSFGREAFTSTDWHKTYTVAPYKITLTRTNDPEQALAYSEYLIYTCGYGQSDMDSYFNDAGFNVIFADYESHALSNFCEIKNLALYEYDLVDSSQSFKARYWVKQDTDTRILVYMLVFPQASIASLDKYSQTIFPELTACK